LPFNILYPCEIKSSFSDLDAKRYGIFRHEIVKDGKKWMKCDFDNLKPKVVTDKM
jgi:hypothetical protein